MLHNKDRLCHAGLCSCGCLGSRTGEHRDIPAWAGFWRKVLSKNLDSLVLFYGMEKVKTEEKSKRKKKIPASPHLHHEGMEREKEKEKEGEKGSSNP